MSDQRTAHPYLMYDAIGQQPDCVARLLRTQGEVIARAAEAAAARGRIVLAGIGSSYHAAQWGEQFLRHLTGGRVQAALEQSFELVHYPLALGRDAAVVAISHGGGKGYTAEALAAAKAAGALTIAVTGLPGVAGAPPGEAMRVADFVLTTCEQEQSFAHTKSLTAAAAALALFAIGIAERRGLLADPSARAALESVPEATRRALACEPAARQAAQEIAKRQRLVFVGAGPNWATAREAALKVKETSYFASEGFEIEQFLHGPIAELDSDAAVVVFFASGAIPPVRERTRAVLRALGELGVLCIAVGTADIASQAQGGEAEHTIEVPKLPEWLSPFVHLVPAQWLSYFLALERGANPDTGRLDQPAHARARSHYKL